jgi:hypothetical protein
VKRYTPLGDLPKAGIAKDWKRFSYVNRVMSSSFHKKRDLFMPKTRRIHLQTTLPSGLCFSARLFTYQTALNSPIK